MFGKLAIVFAISVLTVSTSYAQNVTNGSGTTSGRAINQNYNALSGGASYDPHADTRQADAQVGGAYSPDGLIHTAPNDSAPVTGTVNAGGLH
ncbi:hypothetical protein ACFSHT_28805 [Paraburkholderia silviterrae]|uniref:Uncharacterized protein n=1 Tax=Paraburkholderia silviterrae TaxID=2528715 RepID=A0A4R5M6U8_9BURK|nr:hypothetical protein [Paraburkholderia silviterrae]TDG21170.1 hypothetical protein EYW47_22660 [Paraburkholderia silviterrae]